MTANDDIEDKAAADMDGMQPESETANADMHASEDDGGHESSEGSKSKAKGKKAKVVSRRGRKPGKARTRMMKAADIRAVIAVIVVAVMLVIAVVGGSIAYVASNARKATSSQSPSSSQGTAPSTNADSSVPSDPVKSGTDWLAAYFDEVSAKFPAETFTEGNQNLEKLMSGDASVIPDSISGKMIKGTSTTGMAIGRDVLNSASYIGLIMFSNAYEKTKGAGTQTSGSALASYDGNTNTVFIPVQSLVVSDQNILFELKWDGNDWKLIGDSLGWQTYMMLQNQSKAISSGDGSSSSK